MSSLIQRAVQGLFNSSNRLVGFMNADGSEQLLTLTGANRKTDLRRQEAQAYLYNGALIQAPAWAASTAYNGSTPSFVVRLPAGQLVGLIGTGTSGASAPTFNGASPMSDNTVTWGSIGRISRLATGREVPTIAVSTTAPTGTTAQGVLPAVTGFVCNGYPGMLINVPNGIAAYSQYGNGQASSYPGFYINGSSGLTQGIAGLKGVPVGGFYEFISDAPVIGLNYGNGQTTSGYLWVGDIDGRNMCLVEEGDSVPAGANPYWRNYTWPGGRQLRRYRVESSGSNSYQSPAISQIAVSGQDLIYPAPNDGLRGVFITDSFVTTQAPNITGVSFGQLLGQMALRMAGVRYPICVSQSGAGYVAGSSTWQGANATVPIPALFQNNAFNPAVALSGATVYGTPQQIQPDVVVFAAGYNDNSSPAATITANALYSFQQARVTWPNALIIVFGPAPGPHNGSQAYVETAINNAYSQWADANSAWFPVYGDPAGPWVTGTGFVSSGTGTGNSDFYTGNDGTHPAAWGHQYYSRRYAACIDQAMSAKGL